MSIKFICTGCTAKLQVGSRKAGSETTCPKCGDTIVIPTEEQADALAAMRSLEPSNEASDSETQSPFLEFQVFDDVEYTYIDDEPPITHSKTSSMAETIPISRFVIYTQGSLLGIVAVVCFLLGLMIGIVTTSRSSQVVAKQQCKIVGTVYFREDNQMLPDTGSRVMLLPVDVTPETRPEATALRPGARPERAIAEIQLIAQMGGDVTEVNSQGRFQLVVNTNRKYYLFVISNHRERERDDRIPKKDRAGMGAFFLPIDDLVDGQSYLWQVIEPQGSSMSIPSVLFEN